jgi:cell division protein FtsQ
VHPAEPEVEPATSDGLAGSSAFPSAGGPDPSGNIEQKTLGTEDIDTGSIVDTPPRRSLRLRAALGAAAVLLVAGTGFSRSPFFGADAIRVRGTDHLSRDEVLRIAAIGPGTNVLYLNGGAIEDRLEREPWVASAVVDRDLPATIVVRIRERRPVAEVEVDGAHTLVAEDGTLLGPATGRSLPAVVAGEGAPALDARATAAGARTLSAMPAALRDEVDAVAILPAGLVRVDLDSGVSASLGTARDLVRKAQALMALLRYVEQQQLAVAAIDVSAPSAPTATLADGGVAAP